MFQFNYCTLGQMFLTNQANNRVNSVLGKLVGEEQCLPLIFVWQISISLTLKFAIWAHSKIT